MAVIVYMRLHLLVRGPLQQMLQDALLTQLSCDLQSLNRQPEWHQKRAEL